MGTTDGNTKEILIWAKSHRVEISEEKEKNQGKGGKFWRNNFENFLKLQKKNPTQKPKNSVLKDL